MVQNKVCLIVIDGWGVSEQTEGNAIYHAKTPVMDQLCQGEGYTTLDASGLSVGLPAGLMGNSEVGHLNIGAGRVVYQDIVRINMCIENNDLLYNHNFVNACTRAKVGNGRLHLLGLVSDGGVHSHMDHLVGMVHCAQLMGVPSTYIHFFSDGRDTRPTSGSGYLQTIFNKLAEMKYGSVATLMGRYYAMDRDNRHERIKIAYEGLVQGIGEECKPKDAVKLMEMRYNGEGDAKITDEFMTPIIMNREGLIGNNDTMIFINYRADRMRQINEAFGIRRHFETKVVPENIHITTMTQYKGEFPFPNLFPPVSHKNVLAEALAKANLKQYHCAETEKYAHVTFFFNGGREQQFDMEDRKMVPSPKVATYDLQPEMNAVGVGEAMAETIATGVYPFVMCNFAPPDMVGHTGKYEPAIIACEATDKAIGVIRDACAQHGYTLMVTADHGNAEQMFNEAGGPHTAHTCMRVPFCVVGRKFRQFDHNPALCDVASTVLQEMGVKIPYEMTGQPLLEM